MTKSETSEKVTVSDYHIYCSFGSRKSPVTYDGKIVSDQYLNGLVGQSVPLIYRDEENPETEKIIGSATFCKSNEDDFVYMDGKIVDPDIEKILRTNGSVGLKNICVSTQVSVEIGEDTEKRI